MANQTATSILPPLPEFILRPQPPLINGISDSHLSLILMIVAYWGISLLFHWIDAKDFFPQHRLHTPAELLKRNHVSRWEVFRDVILQQLIQTAFGLLLSLFEPEPVHGREDYDVAVWAQRIRLAQQRIPTVFALLGLDTTSLSAQLVGNFPILGGFLAGGKYPDLVQIVTVNEQIMAIPVFANWEIVLAKAVYWVIIPVIQFLLATFIMDTWQYFWHRAMHMNKWLYTKFHSRHHRLYVPYAYGALYNHPVEGFLLDTLGGGVAYLLTGMTARQAMLFFTISTCKTVDDHCGYNLPWDPFQRLTSNNSAYHDIHHQSWGIKTNFSQPYFTFWDSLMGTRWTEKNNSERYRASRLAAQKKSNGKAVAQPAPSKSSAGKNTLHRGSMLRVGFSTPGGWTNTPTRSAPECYVTSSSCT